MHSGMWLPQTWGKVRKERQPSFAWWCVPITMASLCGGLGSLFLKYLNIVRFELSFEAFLVGNQWWHIKGQMLRKFIWYPKSIFRFIRPSMCISKRIKWIKKKSHREKKIFCIFFQSPHQVDMKNVVECHREFIAYFNALETTCATYTNRVSS